MFECGGGEVTDFGREGGGRFGEGGLELATEDHAGEPQRFGGEWSTPPARPAEHPALVHVEGHQRFEFTADHALVEHGAHALSGQQLPVEAGDDKR